LVFFTTFLQEFQSTHLLHRNSHFLLSNFFGFNSE
jgi:hypothetical protein